MVEKAFEKGLVRVGDDDDDEAGSREPWQFANEQEPNALSLLECTLLSSGSTRARQANHVSTRSSGGLIAGSPIFQHHAETIPLRDLNIPFAFFFFFPFLLHLVAIRSAESQKPTTNSAVAGCIFCSNLFFAPTLDHLSMMVPAAKRTWKMRKWVKERSESHCK